MAHSVFFVQKWPFVFVYETIKKYYVALLKSRTMLFFLLKFHLNSNIISCTVLHKTAHIQFLKHK